MVGRAGGRGRKAPYTTTHVRVPEPMKKEVERLIAMFHEGIINAPEKPLTTLGEATAIAQNILLQKKSAKVSMEKLLTALYKAEVKL
jgi:hypothetical protein